MARSERWQNELSEPVYERLCECASTKKDMVELSTAYYLMHEDEDITVEGALDHMLEWVLDWNGGTWDYTQEEYEDWIDKINDNI